MRNNKKQPSSKKAAVSSSDKQLAQAAHSKAAAHSTAQPGVIASIMQQLVAARKAKAPVTAAQILDVLCKQFAQRERSGMLITVRAQLSRLPRERDFAISKTRDGKFVRYAAS